MTTRMGAVNLMRLWGDLSIWNRFGLAAIGAAIILAIVVSILS